MRGLHQPVSQVSRRTNTKQKHRHQLQKLWRGRPCRAHGRDARATNRCANNSAKIDIVGPSAMKVLVRVPNWIGDAVMSDAALRELRRLHPGDRITVLCRSWVGGLFEDLDVVDEVLAVPDDCFVATRGPRLKCSALIRLARHLKANDYGRAVLFQNAFEAALLACLARIPERIGYGADRRRLLLTASCPPRTRRAGFLRSFAVRTAFRAGVEVFPTRWRPARAGRDHEAYQYHDLLHQTGLSPVDYLNDRLNRRLPAIDYERLGSDASGGRLERPAGRPVWFDRSPHDRTAQPVGARHLPRSRMQTLSPASLPAEDALLVRNRR